MTTAFILTIPIIIGGAMLSHMLDETANNKFQYVLGFAIGVLCATVIVLIRA